MAVDVGISDQPLDVPAAIASVADPACGGIAVFVGTVRVGAAVPQNEDKSVTQLDYEAHPSLATQRLREIAEAAARKWDLVAALAHHRTGTCGLGEPTVVVACSAPHRAEALDACRWMIDEIKSTVPIWKREVYTDGSAWVGTEGS